jgi:hypothetical protein
MRIGNNNYQGLKIPEILHIACLTIPGLRWPGRVAQRNRVKYSNAIPFSTIKPYLDWANQSTITIGSKF